MFLACSETFKEQVAFPIRNALAEHGVRGIIVSEEPLLPRTRSDPDSKVNSYLDASEAFVALCTPDNHLADGTVECRQNIVLEIQRAFDRPGLRERVQVVRAPEVRLPSDINPTYDRLDVDDVAPAAAAIVKQLRAWGVLARELKPAPPPLTEPATVDDLIDGLQLGDHEEANRRAYDLLRGETRQSQAAVVDRLVRFMLTINSLSGDEVHRASSVLEAINRLDSSLVSNHELQALTNCEDFTTRSCAAMIMWDRAVAAPDSVPLGLLGRLALPNQEDWYVQAPAMAATKQLLLHRPAARIIFDTLAQSEDSDDRYAVAAALLDVAKVNTLAVPGDLADMLTRDPQDSVAAKARELVAILADSPEGERDPQSPFGI